MQACVPVDAFNNEFRQRHVYLHSTDKISYSLSWFIEYVNLCCETRWTSHNFAEAYRRTCE